jgi:hypothetical protein
MGNNKKSMMNIAGIICVLGNPAACISLNGSQKPLSRANLDFPWQTAPLLDLTSFPPSPSLNCTTSHASRYSMARPGRDPPAYFSSSPLDDPSLPRIQPMNGTAGEQWEFDGVAADGSGAAFVFGFYRDPNYAFLGAGNLRAYAEFVLPGGDRYAVVDYAEEAVVTSCPGLGARGVWSGKGFRYEWQLSADLSRARIVMDAEDAHVTVAMSAVAPPRYANNVIWPAAEGDLRTVPYFYWMEPIPAAEMALLGVIRGQNLSWTGMGGHERLWGAFNWYTLLASLVAVRFHVGPFAFSMVEMVSGLQPGVVFPSLMLAENGEKVFATQRTEPSDDEDYVTVRKIYEGSGATTEELDDKVTGVELVLVAPGRRKQWTFAVVHSQMLFEYALGEGVGGTAYSGTVTGGLDGGETFGPGPAFTEFMKMPKNSWLLHKNYPK